MGWCSFSGSAEPAGGGGGVCSGAFCCVHLHSASSCTQLCQVKFATHRQLGISQDSCLFCFCEFKGLGFCQQLWNSRDAEDWNLFLWVSNFFWGTGRCGSGIWVKSGSGVFLSFCSSSVKEEELPPLKLEEPAIENVNVLEALLEDYKKAYFLTGAAAIQFWLYNNNICTETLSKTSQINFGFFANKICDTSTHFWHQRHLLRKFLGRKLICFSQLLFGKKSFLVIVFSFQLRICRGLHNSSLCRRLHLCRPNYSIHRYACRVQPHG